MAMKFVKVLVVDDDEAARRFVTNTLEAFGYACRQAPDGIEALEQLHRERFDLMLTGLDMPCVDGLALIERARRIDPELPIVVLTSRADVESGQQALRLGVSDYLVKPVESIEEIQAAARRAVQHRGTRDGLDGLTLEMAHHAHRPSLKERRACVAEAHFGTAPHIDGYLIQQEVGKGGTGTVYKAVQTATQRILALKVIPFFQGSDQVVACLIREIHIAARLQHPNIIRGYDAGLSGGYFYVAMEFVEGVSLGVLLDREGALLEPRAMEIAHQIASALAYAWEIGLVHRDVKPHNILLAHEGVAKLADLGISRDVTGLLDTISSEGTVVGTPLYISPEQAQGLGSVDWRADVYGLGATLYHMVTGVPPFDPKLGMTSLLLKHASEDPEPAHIRNRAVSRRVSQLIQRMMQKDPAKRHATPDELLADCERVLCETAPSVATGSR